MSAGSNFFRQQFLRNLKHSRCTLILLNFKIDSNIMTNLASFLTVMYQKEEIKFFTGVSWNSHGIRLEILGYWLMSYQITDELSNFVKSRCRNQSRLIPTSSYIEIIQYKIHRCTLSLL